MRYAVGQGVLSPTRQQALAEEGIRAFRDYMRGIEALYFHIYSISMPKITFTQEGGALYEHSEWTKDMIAKTDELAKQVKDAFPWDQYGLTKPE